ncbi:hypothetical protein SELMODRAFT_402021 [Selaginella moellendorffii]|uniref:Uncharacterized protein n=1 Tax=Selaginella moellendorffii TaxID=88036 RepID=D8QPC2_SELML|nr:hypothetical protein SELMODRAFT_402021 [Selaginella moellendorffii]
MVSLGIDEQGRNVGSVADRWLNMEMMKARFRRKNLRPALRCIGLTRDNFASSRSQVRENGEAWKHCPQVKDRLLQTTYTTVSWGAMLRNVKGLSTTRFLALGLRWWGVAVIDPVGYVDLVDESLANAKAAFLMRKGKDRVATEEQRRPTQPWSIMRIPIVSAFNAELVRAEKKIQTAK